MRARPFPETCLGLTVLVVALAAAPSGWVGMAHARAGQAIAPGSVVYRAGAIQGWAGWHAPHWTTRNGVLIGHPDLAEIRVPFVPGRHGIYNYELAIRARAGPPDLSGYDSFSFLVRRVRLRGC